MIPISAVIITYNEERNLERCIISLRKVADEVIVVDSLSTDKTVAIAQRLGATVVDQAFLGYVEQKNFALQFAKHGWILSLDADEALSPELEQSLLSFKNSQPAHDAYKFNRLTNYCGSWIRHCGWYPDAKVRLFKVGQGAWRGDTLHEHYELNDAKSGIGKLHGDLRHYTLYSLSDHLLQIDKYTEIAAKTAVARGKKTNRIKIFFAPKWKFFQSYIIKLGFLDGEAGYQVCKMSAFATYLKYAKIRQYSRNPDTV